MDDMAATCKLCKNKTIDAILVPAGVFCSIDHAMKYAQYSQAVPLSKGNRKANPCAAQKFARRTLLNSRKNTLKWQLARTQQVFNKLRVAQELAWFDNRGLEPTCISCGKPKGNDQWCAGHFKDAGKDQTLRFDPLNTHLQHNWSCNKNLSGDIDGTLTTMGYKRGLIARFGKVEGQRIIEYLNDEKRELTRWRCESVQALREQLLDQLKKYL